jgi:sugar/nucleoside kinase (ribokinase family)
MLAEIVARFYEQDAQRRWECAAFAVLGAACGAALACAAIRQPERPPPPSADAAAASGSAAPASTASRGGDTAGIVLSLGISVLDYSVVLDEFPTADTKQVAKHQAAGGGGNAANTAVCVSRLGLPAQLMSKVADDPAGLTLLRQLQDESVRCDDTVQVAAADSVADAGRGTVTCFVLVAGETRTIVSMPYSQRVTDLDPTWVEQQLLLRAPAGTSPAFTPTTASEGRGEDLLGRVALLQLDGRHPAAAARAAELARSRGVPVLVEAELRSPSMMSKQGAELAGLLAHADFIVTSAEYPRAVTGLTDLPAALAAIVAVRKNRLIVVHLYDRIFLFRTRQPPFAKTGLGHTERTLTQMRRTFVEVRPTRQVGRGDSWREGLRCNPSQRQRQRQRRRVADAGGCGVSVAIG